MSQQQDLETVVNALLKGIKQQPISKEVKRPTWIEHRFGVPKSGEEVLWRICWLVVIPAVFILCYLPIADWCWFNGFPMVTILVSLAIALVYYGVYLFATNSAGNLHRLVDVQFAIPPATVFFILCYEVLSRG